jgi:transcriptional regulator with XRE-family HTH domain
MSNYLTIIGQRIREVRKAQKLTQEELARLSGVAILTVKRAEAGEQNIGINTLGAICYPLGVTLVDLVQGIKIPSVPKTEKPAETEKPKSKRNRKPKTDQESKTENLLETENPKMGLKPKTEIPIEIENQKDGSALDLGNQEKPKTQKPLKIKKW